MNARLPARWALACVVAGQLVLGPAAEAALDRGAFREGLEVALAVEQELGLVHDEAAEARLYRLGSRVALAARDDEALYSFHLVDMQDPNAFAVPGGFIFVTRGMLDLDLGDDALASLLGHEVAHVLGRHADRMGLWATITSILQTAVVVGVAVAAQSARRVTYEDEYGRQVQVSSGQTALAGASVFSTVFRELFLRGYSRGLETEADAEGARLAIGAGFSAAGGVEMLESLHQRVYDGGYTYWRTHPYFEDRVHAAEARLRRVPTQVDSARVAAFRQRMQAQFTQEARRAPSDRAALLLYRTALRWGDDSGSAAHIQLELVRFRLARELELPLLARTLSPLAQALAELRDGDAEAPFLAEVEAELERIEPQLEAMEDGYVTLLDAPGAASNSHLERFLDNFPAHPRAAEAQLILGRRHLRDARHADAVQPLLAVGRSAPPDSLADAARDALAGSVDGIDDLSACQTLVTAALDAALTTTAAARLDTLVATFTDLEMGGRFLKEFPEAGPAPRVRQRLEELARREERFARVFEAGGKPQRALDLYNRVVLAAPDSPAARDALEGIGRIQASGT